MIPDGISEIGKQAANEIIKIVEKMNKRKMDTGGCIPFYSPQEWKDRGEEYGLKSILIVCHDGGDLAPFFNLDHQQYKHFDFMVESLEKIGVWAEGCTCWYTAIYK